MKKFGVATIIAILAVIGICVFCGFNANEAFTKDDIRIDYIDQNRDQYFVVFYDEEMTDSELIDIDRVTDTYCKGGSRYVEFTGDHGITIVTVEKTSERTGYDWFVMCWAYME